MSEQMWLLDEIEVEVSGFFTTHHYFETELGTLGEFTFPAFATEGIFRAANGRELVMHKTSWLGSAHELLDGESVRGRADRRGLLHREIDVQFDGREYSLEPEGILSWGWYLVDGEGSRLLEIQPRGVFRQGSYVTILAPVDADLIVFAYYLVHMRQQEDAAAAVAVSASAAS